MTDKIILDPCCGSRMMWFNRNNPLTLFGDNRELSDTLCDGRALNISPDIAMDFTNMPFDDGTFRVISFDPPHLLKVGKTAWLAKKYGKLRKEWKEDLRKAFGECFRVLKDEGLLIFKWNETDIKVAEILALAGYKPLFGHPTGRHGKTIWVTFMKHESLLIAA